MQEDLTALGLPALDASQRQRLVQVVREAATLLAAGATNLSVFDLPEELTTGQAAELLGVSRPTVVAWIDAGKIPSRRAGTRRKLALKDILAYRERRRANRRAAIDELAALSQDLKLY